MTDGIQATLQNPRYTHSQRSSFAGERSSADLTSVNSFPLNIPTASCRRVQSSSLLQYHRIQDILAATDKSLPPSARIPAFDFCFSDLKMQKLPKIVYGTHTNLPFPPPGYQQPSSIGNELGNVPGEILHLLTRSRHFRYQYL